MNSDFDRTSANIRLLAIFWTLIVVTSFVFGARHEFAGAEQSARLVAKAHFAEIKNIRHWVARQGGVYAPSSEDTPPNPYLIGRVEERDLSTPGGAQLTLLNPSYITRLLAGSLLQDYSVLGRLVSLKPIRPENRADSWEASALRRIGQDDFDIIERANFDGVDHIRFIAPLYIDRPCIKCHEEQGKIGDQRGGISVAVPMAPHDQVAYANTLYAGAGHGVMWGLGMAGLLFFGRRLRKASEDVARSEAQKQQILEKAPAFIAHLDGNERYQFANRRFKELGLTHSDITGLSIQQVMGEGLTAQIRPFLESAYQGTTASVETEVTVLRGQRTVLMNIFTPDSPHQSGRAQGVFHMALDITERKSAEEALLRAKDEAEHANRTKSQFLANMSHDLRTPLNAMMGFAQMLEHHTFGPLGDPHYDEYAASIHNSGQHLVSLINDILDISKIESGHYELAEEVMQPADFISDAISMVEPQAKGRGQSIHAVLPAHLPYILCEKRAMVQVLGNLLSNAVKFSPEGGRIDLKVEVEEGKQLTIEVRDHGDGISPSDQQRIFEPFRQAESMLSRKREEGTGLGLFLSRQLTELHGGKLLLESSIGDGTSVTVILPGQRLVAT